MHAWHDRWLFCAGGHCARCMSLIEGNFEPHCHVCLAVHLCWHVVFCPSETQLQNCGRLQNALQQRVPTNAAPSLSLSLNPVNTDEAAASQTVCQRCPPMRHQLGWTWESHPRTNPGGFLCSVWLAWMQKVHRVLTSILLLQPCLSSLQNNNNT